MKLQFAFDMTSLEEALEQAAEVQEHIDIIEIGSLLLYSYGIEAIKRFRIHFPQKTLLADMKIVDRGKEAVALGLRGGADWITVLAGTGTSVIRVATIAAHNAGKKVMLDLIDAHSPEQSALDAVSLGVDALLFHRPSDEENRHLSFLERWDMIRGNTKIPLYIAAPHGTAQINTVIELNPDGLVLSSVAAQQRSILATVLEIRQLLDEQKSQR